MSQRVAGFPRCSDCEPKGLNLAEIELSVHSRQCLDCRIPDQETLTQEVADWEHARNALSCPVDWRFTTQEVHIKLKRLYPAISD